MKKRDKVYLIILFHNTLICFVDLRTTSIKRFDISLPLHLSLNAGE